MNRINRTIPASLSIDKIGRILHYSTHKDLVRKELISLSENHCAYCDCILHISEYTPHIEHFKPREKSPSLENVWHNLFAACPKCNSNKGGFYPNIKPLKPDTLEYDFDYWFEIDWKTCEIFPNTIRNENEKQRAEETIKWLGLNRDMRPKNRKKEAERYDGGELDDWSYRFLLERI